MSQPIAVAHCDKAVYIYHSDYEKLQDHVKQRKFAYIHGASYGIALRALICLIHRSNLACDQADANIVSVSQYTDDVCTEL